MEEPIKCPRCQSTQLSANKKGFGAGKALGGALLFGELGLLAGAAGSNNVIITCLSCGKQFKPGQDLQAQRSQAANFRQMNNTKFGIVFHILFVLGMFLLLYWIGVPFLFIMGFIIAFEIIITAKSMKK